MISELPYRVYIMLRIFQERLFLGGDHRYWLASPHWSFTDLSHPHKTHGASPPLWCSSSVAQVTLQLLPQLVKTTYSHATSHDAPTAAFPWVKDQAHAIILLSSCVLPHMQATLPYATTMKNLWPQQMVDLLVSIILVHSPLVFSTSVQHHKLKLKILSRAGLKTQNTSSVSSMVGVNVNWCAKRMTKEKRERERRKKRTIIVDLAEASHTPPKLCCHHRPWAKPSQYQGHVETIIVSWILHKGHWFRPRSASLSSS